MAIFYPCDDYRRPLGQREIGSRRVGTGIGEVAPGILEAHAHNDSRLNRRGKITAGNKHACPFEDVGVLLGLIGARVSVITLGTGKPDADDGRFRGESKKQSQSKHGRYRAHKEYSTRSRSSFGSPCN